jgi:hypothetical protein
VAQVQETHGQTEKAIEGHERDEKRVKKMERELATQRSKEMTVKKTKGPIAWSTYQGT